MTPKAISLALLAPLGALVAGCCPAPARSADRPIGPVAAEPPARARHGQPEYPVQPIPLEGPASSRDAEISGLAWYRDHLIVLPQYPEAFRSGADGVVFAIPERELHAFVTGASRAAITPRAVDVVAPGLFEDGVRDMQGTEAIAFWQDRVFLTIESGRRHHMIGYLVAGTIAPDLSRITLDTTRMPAIPARAPVSNASEEALIVTRDRVLTIFESNGANINRRPVAHVFDHQLRALGTIPFPSIEYRVIDASELDESNRFWVVNYFFIGDRRTYNPAPDAIAATYGKSRSHRTSTMVERLLLLEYREHGIVLVDRPPIQIELADHSRNWEGMVRWPGHGFLLMTDRFPDTILAYLPYPGI